VALYEDLLPVDVITGFLGSGKTTLLNRLLKSPRLARTAVLVNELGAVPLDHLLLETVDRETVILPSGCVCCTIRGDLADAMRGLLSKRERGLVPAFDRLAIETTGLADPAPIVSTLQADPVLRHHLRLGGIVTTIDAVNGAHTLAAHPESVRQAAVADRLVLTMSDLAQPAAIAGLTARLRALNPAAELIDANATGLDAEDLLGSDVYDPPYRAQAVERWLTPAPDLDTESRHAAAIQAFCLTFDQPLDWTAFGLWLGMLLHAHGEKILRVKAILNVIDVATPVVVHGVQHVVHPPAHLERWPDADHRSRLVFIVAGLDPALIRRSLQTFSHLANATEPTLEMEGAA
jgi:G3E family GTPase